MNKTEFLLYMIFMLLALTARKKFLTEDSYKKSIDSYVNIVDKKLEKFNDN